MINCKKLETTDVDDAFKKTVKGRREIGLVDIVLICVVSLCCCFNRRDLRVFMSSVGRTLTRRELSKKVTERMELH